jgi:hypothetical protein
MERRFVPDPVERALESPLPLQKIETLAVENGEQPSPEAPARIVLSQVPVGLDKSLLADVLGVLTVPQDVQGHGQSRSLMAVHNVTETLPLAPQAGRDDIVVIHGFRGSRSHI